MIELAHKSPDSVLESIKTRSPNLATALSFEEPVGSEPVLTEGDITTLEGIIGVTAINLRESFKRVIRFEVPQGFNVDVHRETLSAMITKVLIARERDSKGAVWTRDNPDW